MKACVYTRITTSAVVASERRIATSLSPGRLLRNPERLDRLRHAANSHDLISSALQVEVPRVRSLAAMTSPTPPTIAPATGRLGVLTVGLGAVASTLIAGVELVKRGMSDRKSVV